MWERPTSQRKICGAVENLSKAERDIDSDDVVDEWPQNSTVVQSTVWAMFSRIPWRVVANSPKTREPTVTVGTARSLKSRPRFQASAVRALGFNGL